MPTLRFRFPGGRYHATPWGHHVNEGHIEWPPSPWRLLRALIACGFNTQHWTEIPPVARQLIEKLASKLPSYRLPSASTAHSRHFMPIGMLDKGREKTTLVFDTWADVTGECLEVHWDCELTEEESRLLGQLAASLGYLGRSESWVEAELVPATEPAYSLNGFSAVPHFPEMHLGPGWEQVSLMAAIPSHEFAAWRNDAVAKALAGFPLPGGNRKQTAKLLKDRAKAETPFPKDLLDCLAKDTAWWKQHRWSQPPGSQRVIYWRRSDALEVGAPRRTEKPPVRPVTTMLLALTTPSGRRSALPLVTRTLPQAELIHQAIVGRVGQGQRVECPELTGRDQQGRPLRDGHRHAHILPVNLRGEADGTPRLDHILVYAPMGLSSRAQQAIRSLRETWTKNGVDLQLALAGSGGLDTLRSLPPPFDRQVDQLLGSPGGSRVWRSLTPFIPPRFLKPRGVNTLLGQINAELASRGIGPLEKLEILEAESIAMRHYVRVRRHGRTAPSIDIGFALRLTLTTPIHGPLSLGYASHFGLGLFARYS